MDQQKVDMFIMTNQKNFPSEKMPYIRERLLAMDDAKWGGLSCMDFKSPTTALILSLFIGGLGVDRFYIEDTALGVGKLLTCGGMGVWSLIDLFLIMGATRERNFQKIQMYL